MGSKGLRQAHTTHLECRALHADDVLRLPADRIHGVELVRKSSLCISSTPSPPAARPGRLTLKVATAGRAPEADAPAEALDTSWVSSAARRWYLGRSDMVC